MNEVSASMALPHDPNPRPCPECGREYHGHTSGAKLTCPSCERLFDGHWHEGKDPEPQQCPACGHEFDATWPGFTLKPEIVVVSPDGVEEGRYSPGTPGYDYWAERADRAKRRQAEREAEAPRSPEP